MPTYDYECTSCSHAFEVFHAMSARPVAKCPKCGRPVRRLIGRGAAVIFKGSGFYETDYKRKRTGGSAEHKEKTHAGTAGKAETKPKPSGDA